MKHALRRVTVGAVAFFAASAFAAPAALAETTADLGVVLGGTTISLGVSAKDIGVQVTNDGPGVADGFKLTFDTSALDAAKVKLVLADWCDAAAKTCEDITKVEKAVNYDFQVFKLERVGSPAPGPAGKLNVTVSSATTDPNPANDSKTVEVTLGETRGVDLKVLAENIWADIDENIIPVKPGAVAVFAGLVYNQGAVDAQGIKATIVLPPGLSFVDHIDICEYSDGDRKAVCSSDEISLPAGGTSQDPETWFTFGFDVKVATTVAGPVNIPGGLLTVEPLGEGSGDAATTRAAAPKKWGDAAINLKPAQYKDVDITDNSDDFMAYVGAADTGGGTGNLPTTGAKSTLIVGVGAGLLVAGSALFMFTRRRRVMA